MVRGVFVNHLGVVWGDAYDLMMMRFAFFQQPMPNIKSTLLSPIFY